MSRLLRRARELAESGADEDEGVVDGTGRRGADGPASGERNVVVGDAAVVGVMDPARAPVVVVRAGVSVPSASPSSELETSGSTNGPSSSSSSPPSSWRALPLVLEPNRNGVDGCCRREEPPEPDELLAEDDEDEDEVEADEREWPRASSLKEAVGSAILDGWGW